MFQECRGTDVPEWLSEAVFPPRRGPHGRHREAWGTGFPPELLVSEPLVETPSLPMVMPTPTPTVVGPVVCENVHGRVVKSLQQQAAVRNEGLVLPWGCLPGSAREGGQHPSRSVSPQISVQHSFHIRNAEPGAESLLCQKLFI